MFFTERISEKCRFEFVELNQRPRLKIIACSKIRKIARGDAEGLMYTPKY